MSFILRIVFCLLLLLLLFETGEGFQKIQTLYLPTQGVQVMEERTITSPENLNQT